MFEFISSANKKTIQVQIDYFERALKESQSQDAYYPERSVFPGESAGETVRRPSEESIGKAREWIALQRKDYPDSKEILDLCKRWEELFDAYQKKMKTERAAIQAQGAEARAQMKAGTGKVSPNGVRNFDGGEGRYGYRLDTGFPKKGAPAAKAETVVVGEGGSVATQSGGKPEASKPSETVIAQASAELSGDFPSQFNESHVAQFKSKIDGIIAKLAPLATEEGSKEVKNLAELRAISAALDAVIKNPDVAAVTKLQEAILAILKDAKFTKGRNDGKPDGLFGPITMENLEKAVDFAKESAEAQTVPGNAPANAPTASGKTESGSFRLKDGTPVKLKDGTPIVGIRFEQGKVWVIGKNGQRVELNAVEGAAGSLKTVEAMTENARKLEALADDGFVLLSALADHAVANKWKAAPEFMKSVTNFSKFLNTLDVSNYATAKAAIVAHVHGVLAEGDLKKEFQEVFVVDDNDAERRKKVYDYVRGSFWPNRRNAGFDGASDSLAKKLAAKELARMDASPADVSKFVTGLVDTELRNKSSAEIAKLVLNSKGQTGFVGFLANTFKTEKSLASFIEDVRESNAELEKAYESKEAKKIFESMTKPDGKPLTQEEIASVKVASRKAKLTEMASAKALAGYAKANPGQRKESFDLDTFADIEGAGTFDMSDRTRKYVRNELWKDLAIEAAAIAAGAFTAGLGTAAVNAAAAARWGNRVHEMMGVRLAAGTIGAGAGFEAGHGGIRSLAATARNDWTPTSAYSWESLLQSMAFGGAFSVAGEILRKSGIVFDASKKIGEQKAVLAAIVGADVTAALGVSYGISAWTGEKWTVEEALQAALMAAAFRGAMTGAQKMQFRAVRNPETGAPTLVPETASAESAAIANADRKVAADAIRWARKEIANLRERIKWNSELLKNPQIDDAAKKRLENEIFHYENEIARLTRQIDVNVAYAPKKVRFDITEDGFGRFANDLVGRLRKVGNKVEAEGYSIVRKAEGYEVTINGKTLRVDTPDMVVKEIMEKVSQPHARAEFLSKFASEALKKRFDALHRKELGDDFRLTSENGVFGFEKKAGNGWEKVSAENVPEKIRAKAGEAVFGSEAVSRAKGALTKLAEKPEKLATADEKNWFVKKFGEKNWIAAMQKFEAKLAGKGEGGHDAHGHGGGGRH